MFVLPFLSYSSSHMNKRRHTLPSSFVDPAIVRYIERATIFDEDLLEEGNIEEDEDEDDMDDQRTTITTVSLPQHLENTQVNILQTYVDLYKQCKKD